MSRCYFEDVLRDGVSLDGSAFHPQIRMMSSDRN
jgi:hypothetical protein